MKINKRSIRKSAIAAVATVLLGIASSCTDLWSEQHPGTFYISDGKTVANFLEEYVDEDGQQVFSDYIYALKKMNLWEDLKTYGDRTVFAPTNKAIREYLQRRQDAEKDETKKANFNSITTLPDTILDTIARTHLCRSSIYIKDLNASAEGALPSSNMLDRYLTFSIDFDSTDNKIVYLINQEAKIVEPDDSTVNGVVQVIDRVISQSNMYIPGYLESQNKKANPEHTANIFHKALMETGLGRQGGELEKFIDYDYHKYHKPQYDSTHACLEFTKKVAVSYDTGNEVEQVVWPEERYFKYTLFVVTDTILAYYKDKYTDQAGLDGIRSYDDLVKYADEVYPDGKGKEATDTESSIYKLISYHILPCFLPRNLMNFTNPDIVKDYSDYAKFCDIEDFYETMHPYAIMRISTPYDPKVNGGNGNNIYINRKGTLSQGNLDYPGVLIWSANATKEINTVGALNGGYYFVDRLLLFDEETRNALTTRIRVMGNTLSPDFLNTPNARGRMTKDDKTEPLNFECYSFKDGFCKNFKANNDQTLMVVRYQRNYWDVYMHDEMNIRGLFDFTLRLPPIPKSGTYEIRVFGNAQAGEAARSTRGIVQFMLSKDGGITFEPLDIPVDMAKPSDDPSIGYVKDEDLTKDITDEDEKEKAIIANDKAMRNRGYMKAPGNFKVSSTGGTNLRDNKNVFRKIICTDQFIAGQDYYLRFRQVKDSPESIYQLNFIEIVPKEVFAGKEPEDKY